MSLIVVFFGGSCVFFTSEQQWFEQTADPIA
jgi:hypothetical protein